MSCALSRRVELKLIDLSRKSNAVDLAVARGQSTPTVSVGGGVLMYMDDTRSYGSQLVTAGLVKCRGEDCDARPGCRRRPEPHRCEHAPGWGVRRPSVARLQKSIAADVQDAWESMELAKEKVDLAQQTAENDDLLVEVYKIQSRNGTASTQDLLTASVNAASAHSAFVQAQASAQLAVLQLLNAMGY